MISEGGYGCRRNSTWPVCSTPAGNTPEGLCDVAGNLGEWVEDDHHGDYGGRRPTARPGKIVSVVEHFFFRDGLPRLLLVV